MASPTLGSSASASRAEPAHLLFRDIHAPLDTFFDVVEGRARRTPTKDLILLTANWQQYDLAVNLITNLVSLGLHHYLLLADNAALAEHAQRRGVIATVWSSMLDRFAVSPDPACACLTARPDGWTSMPPVLPGPTSVQKRLAMARGWARDFPCNGTSDDVSSRRDLKERAMAASQQCRPSAATFYECHAVRRLWLMRWHYAARLIGRGYGVLLLDSDSLVFHDPYPLIHGHLRALSAIGMEDVSAWPQMTVNGGTWYLRARPNGPVHALLRRFVRRAMRVLRAYPELRLFDEGKRRKGKIKAADFLLFDQTVLNTVLLEWLTGRPLELNSSMMLVPISHRHPDWSKVQWTHSCCHPAPPSLGHPPWTATAAQRAAPLLYKGASTVNLRQETLRPYGRGTRLRLVELSGAHGEQTETVAKAPPWLFSGESDASLPTGRTAATFWGATPPPAAVVHFVCTSWPGSDGRRAAMRAWGQWHAREVEAETADPKLAAAFARRRRGFVSFDGPVAAADPEALAPYYRLLALVAHATRRTPVLPTMRCDMSGQRWVDERIHVRTGDMRRREKIRHPTPRPCGWAEHTLGGEQHGRPLCIQRPMQGCFHAFATPDEIAPHVPRGFWSDYWKGGACGQQPSAGGSSDDGRCMRQLPPRIEIPPIKGKAVLNQHTASSEQLHADALQKLLAPYALPANSSAPPLADELPLLMLTVPTPAALAKQSLLNSVAAFDVALQAIRKGYGPDYQHVTIGDAWARCLKMVKHNKCTSVC